MRIEADREVCTSAGMCALTAPEWFGQDEDDGRVIVLPRAEEPDATVASAAELCPSGAIRLS